MRQIPQFKRKTARLSSGEYPMAGFNNRTVEVDRQQVEIVRALPDTDDEEDRYVVETSKGRIVVDGFELHPTPGSPATNVELITHIMEFGSTAMVQAFIMNAVQQAAEKVVENEAEVLKNFEGSMISGPTWVATAKEILEALKAHRN